jgi:hypothetical protein
MPQVKIHSPHSGTRKHIMSSGKSKTERKGGTPTAVTAHEESLRKGDYKDRNVNVGGAASVDSGGKARDARKAHHGDNATRGRSK